MAIPLPGDVRELPGAPSYLRLPAPRAGGSPRNWVVGAGLEGDRTLGFARRPGSR